MSTESRENKRTAKILQFIQSSSSGIVNSTLLQGPDLPAKSLIYAAIFPSPGSDLPFFMLIAAECIDPSQLSFQKTYSDIIHSQIPDNSPLIMDDPNMRSGWEAYQALELSPSIVLTFGKTFDSQDEVKKLYTILGISPQTALSIIKYFTKITSTSNSNYYH